MFVWLYQRERERERVRDRESAQKERKKDRERERDKEAREFKNETLTAETRKLLHPGFIELVSGGSRVLRFRRIWG